MKTKIIILFLEICLFFKKAWLWIKGVYKYLKQRYLAKNSNWGKKLQRLCIALGSVGVAGQLQIQQLPKWSWLPTYLEYAAFAGIIGAFLFQFSQASEEAPKQPNV